MLLCVVVGVMVIFYLVNHFDPNIQAYTWYILSMTVSIFCAVFAYSALHRVIVLLTCGRHISEEARVVVHLSTYLLLLFVLQVILWLLRRNEKALHAWATVWSHMVGFAAMYGFVGLQGLEPMRHSIWLCAAVGVVAWIGIVVASMGMEFTRQFVARFVEAHVKAEEEVSEEKWEEEWDETVAETEDDAASLCLGLLVVQVLCFGIIGRLPGIWEAHNNPKPKSFVERAALFGCAFGFAVVTVLTTRLSHDVAIGAYQHKHILVARAVQFVPHLASMAMAFSLVYWGEWQFQELGVQGPRIGESMIIALCMTLFALVATFAVNCLRRWRAAKAMRSVILGFGLVVGLLWERCFDIALEDVAAQYHMAEEYIVVPLSIVLCSIVLPAWAWYIMPKAAIVATA